MAVNTLVTGLILFRIIKVYWKVEPVLYEKMLDATRGSKVWSVVLVLIETAVAMFALQVILVVTSSVATVSALDVGTVFTGMHQMFLVSYIFATSYFLPII